MNKLFRQHFKNFFRPILLVLILGTITLFYLYGGYELLSFQTLQKNLRVIQNAYETSPFRVTSLYLGLYILITSLSIPGAIILTLVAGAIFGIVQGTLLVALASCCGACLSFCMSRYLFRDFFMNRFHHRFESIDEKVNHEGKMYLLSVRMIPASPFVVVNILMGLTSMKLRNFAWVSLVGMLPGTAIYVYIGRHFSELHSISGIMSWPIAFSLTAMGLLPFAGKKSIALLHKWKSHELV